MNKSAVERRHYVNTTIQLHVPGLTTTGDSRINYERGMFVGRNSIHEKMFNTVTIPEQCRLGLKDSNLRCMQRTQIVINKICDHTQCH